MIASTSLSFKITDAQSSPQPVIVTIFASSKIGEQLLGWADYSVMHAATILSFSKASSTLAALTTKPNGLNPLHETKAIFSLIFSPLFHSIISLLNLIIISFVKWTSQKTIVTTFPVGRAKLS